MDTLLDGKCSAALAELVAAQDKYLAEVAGGLTDAQSDADTIAEVREREMFMRRMAILDQDGITQLERRSIPARTAMCSTSVFLQQLLRLSPFEAKRRVDAASACAPRLTVTGEVLPPLRPILASAQESGQVSADHTRIILRALHKLPVTLPAAAIDQAEYDLVHAAKTLQPREVGLVGERLRDYLDPDGVLASDQEHRRLRSFYLHAETDGSYTARGRLTPECGAKLMAMLSAHSAPQSVHIEDTIAAESIGNDGPTLSAPMAADTDAALLADERSYPQRVHDALEHIVDLALADRGATPSGAPAEVILTMTVEQFTSR